MSRFAAIALLAACSGSEFRHVGAVAWPRLSSDLTGGNIIVIGDIHSDYGHFSGVLRNSDLMDESAMWTGAESTLVLLGDYTQGRRPSLNVSWKPIADADKKILDLIARLSEQALQSGGEVIPIQGNHDLMQVLGIGGEYIAADQDTSEFQLGQKYGDQIAGMPVIRKIGKLLFTHGGLGSLQKTDLEGTPEEIMQKLQEVNLQNLKNNITDMSKYPLQHDESVPTDEILEKLGVECLIVGHKPGNYVRRVQNSSLIRVDSQISRAFGDYGEALERGSHLVLPEGDLRKAKVQYNTDKAIKIQLKKPSFGKKDLNSDEFLEKVALS